MEKLTDFYLLAGECLMECQRIEHDIKIIYAALSKEDYEKNLEIVKEQSLGAVLKLIRERLKGCKESCLVSCDFELLKQINDFRNWLVHRAYMEFIYDDAEQKKINFEKNFMRLMKFNLSMKHLANNTEKLRLEIATQYL